MKQSELIQLSVLFNKFRNEYVKTSNTEVEKSFSLVDSWIDYKMKKESTEGTLDLTDLARSLPPL